MDQVIIYPKDDGGVAIVVPAPECGLSVQEVADKSVPSGKPYRIINRSEVPLDRTFRNAWEYQP